MPRTCSSCHACCGGGFSRRQLFQSAMAGVAAPLMAAPGARQSEGLPNLRKPLIVQPVLIYQIYKPKPQTSWRAWGGLFTEREVAEEKERIGRELAQLQSTSGVGLEIRPLRAAASKEEAAKQSQGDHDVLLLYPATGPASWLEAASAGQKWTLIFLRHQSGPVYEWYEIVSPRFLRKTVDEFGQPGITTADIVVDKPEDLAMRMRGLYGLKNTYGRRIVALGGAAGWGTGGRKAPQLAQEVWKLDIVPASYDELGTRIKAARANDSLVKKCRSDAAAYLKDSTVSLETTRESVDNAFVLTEVLRGMMRDANADALTINNCMSTIMPIGETTACLPLSLINDSGALAFCESDFVVIPSGILLNAISNQPVFLNDPTYPHHGMITLAHCTAPRKMDGTNSEPVRLLTHFESDYGAAPKVEMHIGTKLTNIIPDFNAKRWVGFEGEVLKNPFLPICRSQIESAINGDSDRVAQEMQGFHWMTGYGNWLAETGYALQKAGVNWLDLTKEARGGAQT